MLSVFNVFVSVWILWRQGQPTVSIPPEEISLQPLSLSVGNRFGYCSLLLLSNTQPAICYGEQWSRLMREGEHVLTFSRSSFVLMHLTLHAPPHPSSFVEHLSFPINLHQSLYPCWVKNGTHYFCHKGYRNSILSTGKRQVKQLIVAPKDAGWRPHGINHSQILDHFLNRSFTHLSNSVLGIYSHFRSKVSCSDGTAGSIDWQTNIPRAVTPENGISFHLSMMNGEHTLGTLSKKIVMTCAFCIAWPFGVNYIRLQSAVKEPERSAGAASLINCRHHGRYKGPNPRDMLDTAIISYSLHWTRCSANIARCNCVSGAISLF